DPDELQQRLKQPDHAAAQSSLEGVGFQSVVGLLGTYAGQARDLEPWMAGASINRDQNLRLQFLAGLHLNLQGAGPIYFDMLRFRRYPNELFFGSGIYAIGLKSALERAIEAFHNGNTQE